VLLHTIKGAWRYLEHDWIARTGDTVYELARPEALEDTRCSSRPTERSTVAR